MRRCPCTGSGASSGTHTHAAYARSSRSRPGPHWSQSSRPTILPSLRTTFHDEMSPWMNAGPSTRSRQEGAAGGVNEERASWTRRPQQLLANATCARCSTEERLVPHGHIIVLAASTRGSVGASRPLPTGSTKRCDNVRWRL